MPGIWLVSGNSVGPLEGRFLRSESQWLGACSVGLRRSEIDGYFLGRETLGFDSITAGLWLALQCPSR